MTTIPYRPEVDGLRTVAVMSVIIYHADIGLFSGGYVGVDVFYVISGYLITSIIISARALNRFSLLDFYERRARRILPPLFAMVALTIPLSLFLLRPLEMKDFAQSVAAVATFSSNFLFYSESDYFAPAADLKPLLHTWSLAVEEQYYLLFPLLILAIWRFGSRGLLATLAGLALASWALGEALPKGSAATFYLLPTRAWELLVGSITAILLTAWSPTRGRQLGSMLGLVAIGWAVIALDDNTAFPGAAALAPTLGAALVIIFARPGTVAHSILSSRPFVFIGLCSYSIYLLHQPLLAFARIYTFGDVSLVAKISLMALSIAGAVLFRRYIERPFRDRALVPTRTFFTLAAAVTAIFLAFGAAGHFTDGFQARFAEAEARARAILPGYEPDNQKLYGESKVFRSENSFSFAGPPDSRRVLIVGNSHAEDLFGALSLEAARFPGLDFSLNFIRPRCLADLKAAATRRLLESENFRRADVILVSARWSLTEKVQCDGRGRALGEMEGLESLLKIVRASGKTLVLTGASPEFPTSGTLTLADEVILRAAQRPGASIGRGGLIKKTNDLYFSRMEDLDKTNLAIKAFAARNDIAFLDKTPLVCPTGTKSCLALNDRGQKTMWDYAHYTLAGAHLFGERAQALGWREALLK